MEMNTCVRTVRRGHVAIKGAYYYAHCLPALEGCEVQVKEVIDAEGCMYFVEADQAWIPLVAFEAVAVRSAEQYGASSLRREAVRAFRVAQAESRDSLERLYSTIKNAPHYETLSIGREAVDVHALDVLTHLDGLTVADVRQVLNRAGFWLDAVSTLNCGEATEFARAVEGLQAASETEPQEHKPLTEWADRMLKKLNDGNRLLSE